MTERYDGMKQVKTHKSLIKDVSRGSSEGFLYLMERKY